MRKPYPFSLLLFCLFLLVVSNGFSCSSEKIKGADDVKVETADEQSASQVPVVRESDNSVSNSTSNDRVSNLETVTSTVTSKEEPDAVGKKDTSPVSPSFSRFNPPPFDTSGTLMPYAIDPTLDNVIVSAVLTSEQNHLISQNGFVVSPGRELEFHTVYEKARYRLQPVYITVDSMLHSFHLVFDKVLRTAEEKKFIPLIKKMNSSILDKLDESYRSLQGTDWETAAKRAVGLISVGTVLLDDEVAIPDYIKEAVDLEVQAINSAGGVGASELFPGLSLGEDYTQYKPRGHYTKSENLKKYFRTMMYYGRMTFLLSNDDDTKAAVILALAFRDARVDTRPALDVWYELSSVINFMIGVPDDLTISQYLQKITEVYGHGADIASVRRSAIENFSDEAGRLPGPRILGMVISDSEDIDKATKGMRLMGQVFTWDAFVFRNLVWRNVGGQAPPDRRGLPKGLDVFAAMGSDRALEILAMEGDTALRNYNSQMRMLRRELGTLKQDDWAKNLYSTWLYNLKAVAQPVPDGYPSFMKKTAFLDRLLYSALGSFAELKHDTILYAKQSYAESGGGGKGPPPNPIPPPGFVEPLPAVWAGLAALADMTREGMERFHLIDPGDVKTLKMISTMSRKFRDISGKELKGIPLAPDEHEYLRYYGAKLEEILFASSDMAGSGGVLYLASRPQAAVIADVATDSDPEGSGAVGGIVLEMGIGRIFDIYAVVPVDGRLYLARGGVFSYYEFPHPMNDRLTDEQWRTMLDKNEAPPPPVWTSSFLGSETVESELSIGIRRFQNRLTKALWYNPRRDYRKYMEKDDPVSRYLSGQLEFFIDTTYFEGRQRVETSFRSFDLVDEGNAIVTTRETWNSTLHREPTEEERKNRMINGPQVGKRGPLTHDVTYTLTLDEKGKWWVINIVVEGTLPPWQMLDEEVPGYNPGYKG